MFFCYLKIIISKAANQYNAVKDELSCQNKISHLYLCYFKYYVFKLSLNCEIADCQIINTNPIVQPPECLSACKTFRDADWNWFYKAALHSK